MGGDAVGTVLLITDVALLPAKVVVWALDEFADESASGKGLAILTQVSRLDGKLQVEPSSVDVIVSLAEAPGHHSSAWLAELSRALKPGGVLIVQEPLLRSEIPSEQVPASAVQRQSVLQKRLLLAGFVDSTAVDVVEGVGLGPRVSDLTPSILGPQLVQLTAVKVKKPSWETGSSFSLKKTAVKQEEVAKANGTNGKVYLSDVTDFNINEAPLANGVVRWKVPAVDLENDELVDEDSLLTEEDLKKPELSAADDDCEVGQTGRKACKNCTCGRAELEDEEKAQPQTKLTLGQINNPQSACGNCGLGDAFRCGGCPYKGLPSFQLGEKIALPSAMLTADV